MMKYIFSIFLVNIFISVAGQVLPTIIPQSPEAASLAKYCEFPVSNFTGIPDINLPLFTVQSGDISIPIQLNYNAAGFRVTEEASWVGLGWTLSTSAMISRTIHGIDDFKSGLLNANTSVSTFYLSSANPKIIDITGGATVNAPWICYQTSFNGDNGFNSGSLCKGDYSFCRSNYPTVNGEISQTNYYDNYIQKFDWEPDAFFLNLFGNNNIFVYDQDHQINFVNKSDVEIKGTSNGWKVRTHDGFEYLFEKQIIASNWYNSEVSSEWHLTKIISPLKHEAEFSYSNFDPNVYDNLIESYSYNEQAISNVSDEYPKTFYVEPGSVNVTRFLKNYLERINFDNGTYVTFTRDTSAREDLKNGEKLKYIRIYDSNDILVREFELVTDYFRTNNTQRGFTNGYNVINDTVYECFQKRLKLISVIERNGNNSKTYSFEYSDIDLPNKDSFKQDHWGFYNNNGMNSLVPSFEGLLPYMITQQYPNGMPLVGEEELFKKYNGANRESHADLMKACIIKSIKYPTGGSTTFEFEANDYLLPDPLQYVTQEMTCESDEDPVYIFEGFPSYNIRAIDSGSSNVVYYADNVETNTITFPFPPDNDLVGLAEPQIEILVYATDIGNITLSPNMYAQITGANFSKWIYFSDLNCINSDLNGSCITYQKIVPLPDNICGPITMTLVMPDATNPQTALFTLSGKIIKPFRGTKLAGGLRIKQITHQDPLNPSKDIIKTYEYLMPFEDENQQTVIESSGILKKPLRYYYMLAEPSLNASEICFTSSTYYGSGYEMGNHIGYSKIIEYSGANGESGRTEYIYRNNKNILYNSPIRPVGVPSSYRSALDGTLYKKSIYDKDNHLLAEKQQNFGLREQMIIKGIFQDYNDNGDAIYGQGGFHYYPIYTRWEALSSSYDRLYNKDNIDQYVETRTLYDYNQTNLLPKTVTSYTSKKDTLIAKTYYPTDVTNSNSLPGGTLSANELNMINLLKGTNETVPFRTSEILQKELWNNNILLSRERINYNTFNNIILPDTLKSAIYSNDLENRMIYSSYDNKGNVQEMAKDNDVKYAFFWSYNQTYPVIKAENIDFNTLNNEVISIQNNLQNFLTNDVGELLNTSQKNAWKDFDSSLRAKPSLKNALITTYTYKPFVGITSETDPNGVTTYYEYDALGRLKCIRNDDGNIIKTYDYHYQEQQ